MREQQDSNESNLQSHIVVNDWNTKREHQPISRQEKE